MKGIEPAWDFCNDAAVCPAIATTSSQRDEAMLDDLFARCTMERERHVQGELLQALGFRRARPHAGSKRSNLQTTASNCFEFAAGLAHAAAGNLTKWLCRVLTVAEYASYQSLSRPRVRRKYV